MTDTTDVAVADAQIQEHSTALIQPASHEPNRVAAAIMQAPRSILPAPLDELRKAAHIIAMGNNAPVAFQGQPEKCLSIAYQAALWHMDPVAVASKCYLVSVKGGGERLAYEAQLIKALILSKVKFEPGKRLRVTYYGTGQQRYAVAEGTLLGETEPSSYSSPIIGQITPKNSPLWVTDPDQQLDYYACRAWCRRHRPDVILGVYSPDEFPPIQTLSDVTPKRSPYAPQIAQAADGSENPASPADSDISGSSVDVSAEPPPPSGGRGVVNRDDKSKTTKAGNTKPADIGPNPWPDVDDVMEWLAGFKVEIETAQEIGKAQDVIKLWDQAKAHGLIGRLKKAAPTDAQDLAQDVERVVGEMQAKEAKT